MSHHKKKKAPIYSNKYVLGKVPIRLLSDFYYDLKRLRRPDFSNGLDSFYDLTPAHCEQLSCYAGYRVLDAYIWGYIAEEGKPVFDVFVRKYE
jgi:hypothetical protein